tara:strand:+ start:783 stop:1538 length:756 start_codon:yes stop_codon:yes gene_type:complete
MFKLRYKKLIFLSNKPKFSDDNYLIIFYGLGCSSDDLSFLLFNRLIKKHILIPELPGHNNTKNHQSLLDFSKSMSMLLKRSKRITFFSHSVGGIIPILMCKYFLKNKDIFLINYEGNLTEYDTETLTKKTVSFDFKHFIEEKFYKLVEISKNSSHESISKWSLSLKKTSPEMFYKISLECVRYSKRSLTLSFFKTFFKKKVYISGEKSNLKVPFCNLGSPCYKIKNTGHFSYYDDKVEFTKIFNYLLLKRC